MTQSRWEAWLYERHSRAELREWATRLRWFRYCRAIGGHANRTVASAIAIEAMPAMPTLQVIDPPLDDEHCVCPKYYPELWAGV
jgi:hypothetical protein